MIPIEVSSVGGLSSGSSIIRVLSLRWRFDDM